MDKFSRYKQCIDVLQRHLCTPPYSAGFASFLIQKKRKCEGILSPSLEQLILKCTSDIRDFDCYRLSGGNFSEIDERELEKIIARDYKTNNQGGLSYLDELKKRVTPDRTQSKV